MSYYGRSLDSISNVEKLDNITFDGSTSYALTKSSAAFTPAGKNNILISVSGVIQQGNFSVSGSNIVFDSAVASTESCDFIMHYGTGLITTPADATVTDAKIVDMAASKLTGTVAQANIADQAINEAKMQISNTPTNGYMLTAQSGNTGGLTWAAAPSATGLTHISTVSGTSAVSSVLINDCFSSTYKTYKLFGTVLVGTDDTKLEMQYTKSSGSTVGTDSYRYILHAMNLHSDSSRSDASTGNWNDTGGAELVYAIDNDATYSPAQFEMTFYDPLQTFASYQYFDGQFTYYSSGGQFRIGTLGGQYRSNFNATGLKFKTDSNNFSRYYFNVYVITNSGS